MEYTVGVDEDATREDDGDLLEPARLGEVRQIVRHLENTLAGINEGW